MNNHQNETLFSSVIATMKDSIVSSFADTLVSSLRISDELSSVATEALSAYVSVLNTLPDISDSIKEVGLLMSERIMATLNSSTSFVDDAISIICDTLPHIDQQAREDIQTEILPKLESRKHRPLSDKARNAIFSLLCTILVTIPNWGIAALSAHNTAKNEALLVEEERKQTEALYEIVENNGNLAESIEHLIEQLNSSDEPSEEPREDSLNQPQ